MLIYPMPLSPCTAEEAYSYLPDDFDFNMHSVIKSARSSIPFAKHALLELRSLKTGKRRMYRTRQFVIPLTRPTNDHDLLEKNAAIGSQISLQVNDRINRDWIASVGFPLEGCWLVTGESATVFSKKNEVTDELQRWLDETVGAGEYVRRGRMLAFRDPTHASACKIIFG